jgi:hypothetical protein
MHSRESGLLYFGRRALRGSEGPAPVGIPEAKR